MKEQDAGQLGTDSPRETIQLVQKEAGIGLDPEPGEYQGETSYESFERRVFGFATDHLQFRLFPIFPNHVHRTLHPDRADQTDDKAQTFDVHAVRSRFLQAADTLRSAYGVWLIACGSYILTICHKLSAICEVCAPLRFF